MTKEKLIMIIEEATFDYLQSTENKYKIAEMINVASNINRTNAIANAKMLVTDELVKKFDSSLVSLDTFDIECEYCCCKRHDWLFHKEVFIIGYMQHKVVGNEFETKIYTAITSDGELVMYKKSTSIHRIGNGESITIVSRNAMTIEPSYIRMNIISGNSYE